MLSIQFSNRLETLREALVARVGGAPGSPFAAQQIVVPSSAMRRHLTLAIADQHGVCANVEFVYLAQWLWSRISHGVESVETDSPFASPVLMWRVYQLLEDSTWYKAFPRLANYLRESDPLRRLDLAAEIAVVLEQYITYRQDWLSAWLNGARVDLKSANSPVVRGSSPHSDDQDWQAELWRRLSAEMGSEREHPANRFFRVLRGSADDAAHTLGLPEAVHIFCLPAMPPLYLDVLIGLGRWVDVHLYVLNPCNEYWFEIVDPKRLSKLAARGAGAYQETGNRLLASWGQQTKAQIEQLLDRSEHGAIDDSGYDDDFPDTLLGNVQRSIFNLADITPGSIGTDSKDRSIEVHVCHSLTRELEVLQDQLLAMFAGEAPPQPSDILVVTPDLEAAAPLIDAVFGNAATDRYLPYAVTGRGRSTINAPARALLALIAILPTRFAASALVELLQQPIIGRRFGIGNEELMNIEGWLHDSGIRWGINGDHRREQGLPDIERFSVEDGLHRLFLGYALPQHVSAPVLDRVPAGNPEGSRALDLGLFAHFFHRLTALRAEFLQPRSADTWLALLTRVLEEFLLPCGDEFDDQAEVRDTIGELHANMLRGGLTVAVPLPVIRSALESLLDDPARGGVPTGSITFSSMSSLRNLPFRTICALGLNDGAFPASSRPTEFDLMAADLRRGDRQRRSDDRNLFLDLLLAARQTFYLSYSGRSIRDNSILPASVVVSELIETLVPAVAGDPTDPASISEARRRLVIEHPLQAFSTQYFAADGDPRLRSFNRELCRALESQRHASEAAAPAETIDDEDEEPNSTVVGRFFDAPLALPTQEWRDVSLDQLIRFFRNPSRFLLRDRLGIALYREESVQSDDEPFLPDIDSRQALAERLLPQAMRGLGDRDLESLARAGIEYPPGTLGTVLLREEMATLRQFAQAVKDASRERCGPPVPVTVPFELEGETWRLSTVFPDLRPAGLVRYRYDDARPTDYLAGWLTHLLFCEAAPSGAALHTRWISRDGEYRLEPCRDKAILESLMRLYRRGLEEPLHFFPKSAWAYIQAGGSLGEARKVWHPAFDRGWGGEDRHAAYQLAFRGEADPIDAAFQDCAEAVFGKIGTYIKDDRLKRSLRG